MEERSEEPISLLALPAIFVLRFFPPFHHISSFMEHCVLSSPPLMMLHRRTRTSHPTSYDTETYHLPPIPQSYPHGHGVLLPFLRGIRHPLL